MKIDLNKFREAFLQESTEHIAVMEALLLGLRSDPGDTEQLHAIFRAVHSIKGGAGSFSMTTLVRFTHTLEDMLDKLRSAELVLDSNTIDTLLRSVDVVRLLLQSESAAELSAEAATLQSEIESLASASATDTTLSETAPKVENSELHLFRVEFHPDHELLSSGNNPLLQLRELSNLGSVGCCHLHSDALPPLAELDPAQCHLSWTIELASRHPESAVREVFEFVEHLAEIKITRVDLPDAPQMSATYQLASDGVATEPEHRASALASKSQTPVRKAEGSTEPASIRVAIDKIDRLIDLVGELVIAHVMTAQMVENFEPICLPKLKDSVAAMERNTKELHERVMAVRMLPVGMLFHRFPRTVYDIAQATGKAIRLQMDGQETEIDRGMLESLADPLLHLIRNAADHGIESPERRREIGKPEEGAIALKAFHRAGRVVIEISDDGAGIDIDRVRQKALECGLIEADASLSDDQIQILIFEPGFSTCEEISDRSGRGVGMDVVKRNIHAMNGIVTLESEKGVGCTVTIELPLTLAILDGLLVRVTERTLVVPLLAVLETVPLPPDQVTCIAECGEVIVIREEPIPLLRLARFLSVSPKQGDEEERELAVIVEAGRHKIGLVVDELLGKQQVVVKSLEDHLRKVNGLMGATILGDGTVAPILDISGLATSNSNGRQSVPARLPNFSRAPISRESEAIA